MPATPEQVHAAALDVVADALASDAGPDGKPSVRAKKKARAILDMLKDEGVMAELAEVTGDGPADAEDH
jgi:predicted ArsR family transcriptional regulator